MPASATSPALAGGEGVDPASAGGPARELAYRLAHALGRPLELVVTRNRRSLISVRRRGAVIVLRLHAGLVDLDPAGVGALGDFVAGRPGARARLRALLADRAAAIAACTAGSASARRRPRLDPTGAHHDLLAILDELRATYLPPIDVFGIGWTGIAGRRRQRIRLGSWSDGTRLIRVHRQLDSPAVPRYFVASVVHHEACHAALGPAPEVGGRRIVHGAEFRALERKFPDLERALQWERSHRHLLVGGRPD